MAIRRITVKEAHNGVPFYILHSGELSHMDSILVGIALIYVRPYTDLETTEVLWVADRIDNEDSVKLDVGEDITLWLYESIGFYFCSDEMDVLALYLGSKE
jgi:hypothetical protein